MNRRPKNSKGSSLQDAMRAMQSGNTSVAARHARRHLKQSPEDPQGLHLLGVILFQQGDPHEAAEVLGRAVAAGANEASHLANWGLALKAASRLDEALAAYDRSVKKDPTAASAWNDRGTTLVRLGHLSQAEESFRQSLTLNGRDAKTHTNLGGVLLSLGETEGAAASCKQAIALAPELAPAHNGLGNALSRAGDTAGAIAAFEQAIQLESEYGEALGNLASLYEETSRLEDARQTADQALRIHALNPHAVLVLAKCDRREGAFQTGVDRLKAVESLDLPDALARDVSFELSRLYDRLDDTANAFTAMELGNTKALSSEGVDASLGDQFLDHVAGLRAWGPPKTSAEGVHDGNTYPVFVIGFPRSGTTLLGQVLDSHSGLVLIEERPMLDRVIARIRETYGEYPMHLTTTQVMDLRRFYFEQAAQEVAIGPDQRIVDKFPLHLIDIGLIKMLFPLSKIILAIRHPCDVVLSCFMQNFRPNPAMVNFYNTQRGALVYDRVMDLWVHSEAVIRPGHHLVRYEDVVVDFDGQIGEMLRYLDLPWEDTVRDYAQRAQDRGRIDTPSYHQVTEAIYTRSRYRWRRYEAELKPVMETLKPWVTKFGYDHVD